MGEELAPSSFVKGEVSMTRIAKDGARVRTAAKSLRSGLRTASAGSSLALALMGTTCLCSHAFAQTAQAQPANVPAVQIAQAAPAQTAQAPAVEEVVVTGTRIQRSGYEAPTPVSVVNLDT